MGRKLGKQNTKLNELRKEIYNDILNGATYTVMINKIREGVYEGAEGTSYSEIAAKKLIAEAKKLMRDDFAEERQVIKENLTIRLMDVYTEAREMGDRASALKALEQMAKLTGVLEPVKIEGKFNSKVVIDFGFDDKEDADVDNGD